MTFSPLQNTQQRLARHYLNRLRAADAAVRRGQSSATYGLSLLDQEWEQIRHWQALAAQQKSADKTWMQLCREFPLAGLEILPNRNNAGEQAEWLVAALEAAHQLHDHEAERALCYELFMTYYRLGVIERIEYYANHLLEMAKAAKDSLFIERAYFGLGLVAEERGLFSEAESHYQKALRLAEKVGIDDEIAQALNGLGTVATYQGNYQQAYPCFLRQLQLMEATDKKSEVCHALLSMGGFLLWQKDYTSADHYLERAAVISQALGLRRLYGVSLIHLGASALEQNRLEEAYHYLAEGLDVVRSVGVVRQVIVGLALLGYVWLRRGDSQAALIHLREGLQIAREAKSSRNIFNLQCNMVKTYLVLNDADSARDALKEVLTIAQNLNGHPQKAEAVSMLVAFYAHLGLSERAAVLAGAIVGDPEPDQAFIVPVLNKLEASLGSHAYQQALARGKTQTLDQIIAETISSPF